MPVTKTGSREELDRQLSSDSNSLFIVKMGATWCKPCQQMDEPLNRLSEELAAREHKVVFLCVDRDDDTEEMFDTHEITTLPTLLLFKECAVIEKLPRPSTEQLRDTIHRLLPSRELVLDGDF